ncbi:spinster family MFS transporter [Pseudomonas neustonica]|uniref:MFS transporter n=1 Tax=Pseudomonas neustonica TaxID=2487346 RepID=A0ABX9XNA2_9PSED|nr:MULTISPECIES: MFS transporter [Pseudomonas]ROZ86861.1 MFS transporter [Pseudomonas sp. SSM44]ROZ88523.1 MFS transporter [Pseudomonas neustonica]
MNDQIRYPTTVRAWCTVGILLVAYVLSFVDRQILNLLVGPIRADLGINDTQMSLLMGLSFAIFYTIAGIPLGRIADSKSRRGLIAWGVAFWSLMTAACGLAQQYWHFILCRIGVGAGEAALSPAAYSLIADSFPADRRATAISVYAMGIYLGAGMAFLLGGIVVTWANAQGAMELPVFGVVRPWQLIFLVLGAVGLMFCLVLLAIKEPTRKGVGAGVAVPLKEVGAYLLTIRKAVLCHNFGFACLSFASYGASAWIPTFFIRTHGLTPGEVGIYYGSLVMVAGSTGIVFGGRLADYMARRGYRDANMRVGLLAAVLTLACNVVFLVDNMPLLWAIMFFNVFTVAMPFGVAPAAIQEVMPNAMRGQASAIYLFTITLIGLGIGPTAVALVTDYVFMDDMAIRYSIFIVASVITLGAIILLWMGLKPYREARDTLESWSTKQGQPG